MRNAHPDYVPDQDNEVSRQQAAWQQAKQTRNLRKWQSQNAQNMGITGADQNEDRDTGAEFLQESHVNGNELTPPQSQAKDNQSLAKKNRVTDSPQIQARKKFKAMSKCDSPARGSLCELKRKSSHLSMNHGTESESVTPQSHMNRKILEISSQESERDSFQGQTEQGFDEESVLFRSRNIDLESAQSLARKKFLEISKLLK